VQGRGGARGVEPEPWPRAVAQAHDAELVGVIANPLGAHAELPGDLSRGEQPGGGRRPLEHEFGKARGHELGEALEVRGVQTA
jgi:hypothetical protein